LHLAQNAAKHRHGYFCSRWLAPRLLCDPRWQDRCHRHPAQANGHPDHLSESVKNMSSLIAFFPWVTLDEPLTIGDVRLFPYERGERPGDHGSVTQGDIDGVLAAYATRKNKDVNHATLVEIGEWHLGQESTAEIRADLFRAREFITFAALARRRLFRGHSTTTTLTTMRSGGDQRDRLTFIDLQTKDRTNSVTTRDGDHIFDFDFENATTSLSNGWFSTVPRRIRNRATEPRPMRCCWHFSNDTCRRRHIRDTKI
jgi:hypothetical protein